MFFVFLSDNNDILNARITFDLFMVELFFEIESAYLL